MSSPVAKCPDCGAAMVFRLPAAVQTERDNQAVSGRAFADGVLRERARAHRLCGDPAGAEGYSRRAVQSGASEDRPYGAAA